MYIVYIKDHGITDRPIHGGVFASQFWKLVFSKFPTLLFELEINYTVGLKSHEVGFGYTKL